MKGRPARAPSYPNRRNIEHIANGWCTDCPWTASGPKAMRRAADHARWSRHRVRTTTTTVTVYSPRKTPKENR